MNVGERFVEDALRIGAIEIVPEGRQLRSGRISPYFFNAGLFSTGEALSLLSNAYADCMVEKNIVPEVIFGPAYKGIPLACATAVALYERHGRSVGYAFNRKEAKDHAEKGVIVGAKLKGKRTAEIDDVITDGVTKTEGAAIIRGEGGILTHCIIAFDRQERGTDSNLSGAQRFEQTEGVPLIPMSNLDNLVAVLKRNHPSAGALPAILAYRERYGARNHTTQHPTRGRGGGHKN